MVSRVPPGVAPEQGARNNSLRTVGFAPNTPYSPWRGRREGRGDIEIVSLQKAKQILKVNNKVE